MGPMGLYHYTGFRNKSFLDPQKEVYCTLAHVRSPAKMCGNISQNRWHVKYRNGTNLLFYSISQNSYLYLHIFTKYKQRKSYQYDINSRIYSVHKTVHFILDILNYACGVLTIGCTNILTSWVMPDDVVFLFIDIN